MVSVTTPIALEEGVAKQVGVVLAKPTPSPSGSLRAPPADPLQTAGAIVSIILALAAAVLAYRVLRGGRGL